MKEMGLKKVMLSFVEEASDPAEVRDLLPEAEVVLKIESQRGVAFAKQNGANHGRLMAARGDLYVEVTQPHRIVNALTDIVHADPKAIVASRIFESLAYQPVPVNADISDIAFLLSLGYRTFMLGDSVCLQRDSVIESLNLLQAIAADFPAELGR